MLTLTIESLNLQPMKGKRLTSCRGYKVSVNKKEDKPGPVDKTTILKMDESTFSKFKRLVPSELPKCPLCGGDTQELGSYMRDGSSVLICLNEECDIIGFRSKSPRGSA
jgi:hypothetical protein